VKRLGIVCAVAALLWGGVVASAHASPQDVFGYGGRTQGLAMTGTAYAEGYEAIFANPAGLASERRRGLVLGFGGGGFDLRIEGEREPITPARGMYIGFELPLPFGDFLEDRLTFGGAFFTPAEVLLRGQVSFPAVPQFTVVDRAQVIGLMVGLGIDLHGLVDGLQIGLGVSALADTFGSLDVELDETNAFSSVVELQLLAAFSPMAGIRYTQDEWGVGVTYRHESKAELELQIRTSDLPIEVPVLTVGGIAQYDPSTILVEGYWRPIPDLMLVVNLTTRLWNFYPGAQIPTTEMGRNAPAPGFSPRPSPRVALEGGWSNTLWDLRLRGGYAFEPTPAPPARLAARRDQNGDPVPDEAVPMRLIDSHRHILTAGVGFTLSLGDGGESLTLDAFGQLHLLQDRTHVIGRTEGAPPMTTGGHVLYGGWTLAVHF